MAERLRTERDRDNSLLGVSARTSSEPGFLGRLVPSREELFVRPLILIIGIHSCLLGTLMLFAPGFMNRVFGFSPGIPIFFPSQSGIFLLILGVLYLYALWDPSLVKTILISKAMAVPFLVVHVAFLGAPPSIWAAAAGDATMLVLLSVALFLRKRAFEASRKQKS